MVALIKSDEERYFKGTGEYHVMLLAKGLPKESPKWVYQKGLPKGSTKKVYRSFASRKWVCSVGNVYVAITCPTVAGRFH